MTNKVILVICDALRDDVAAACMGYLEHLVEINRGTRYHVQAELPTLSRPLYETIHTGLPVSEHGITSNRTARLSSSMNVFKAAREQGKTTAAAAYCWYSELYIRAPYDLIQDREIDDEQAQIQHGRFYYDEGYPDIELFADGALLMTRYAPDYLLIHPMGLDTAGHKYGGGSYEYRQQAMLQDQILANLIPSAAMLGYTVLVTGDHGMGEDHAHNGTTPDVRCVPLYILPPTGNALGNQDTTVSQLQLAPTLCTLLDIPIPPSMRSSPINWKGE